MERVGIEPRTKQRKITLHKSRILHDIDVLSYKLAETSTEEPVRDSVASDASDRLDGEVLGQLLESREAILRKKLGFCLEDETIISIDDTPGTDADYIYTMILPESFKDNELVNAVRVMHDYLVKGTLMDWYSHIGTNLGASMAAEVLQLESRAIDIFRKPGFVKHPSMLFYPSYRNR